jgi:hypothetical protein
VVAAERRRKRADLRWRTRMGDGEEHANTSDGSHGEPHPCATFGSRGSRRGRDGEREGAVEASEKVEERWWRSREERGWEKTRVGGRIGLGSEVFLQFQESWGFFARFLAMVAYNFCNLVLFG